MTKCFRTTVYKKSNSSVRQKQLVEKSFSNKTLNKFSTNSKQNY